MLGVSEDDATPLFLQSCVGELSVTNNQFLRKWLLLYNCDSPRGLNFRTTDVPWGPWSELQLLFDPWEDNGDCQFMHVDWQFSRCDSVHDPGRQDEWGGEYGPYQFEDFATGNDTMTPIFYTLSTWNPYTVVLMKSTLRVLSEPTSVNDGYPGLPSGLLLRQNVPNPFDHSTTITYMLPESNYCCRSNVYIPWHYHDEQTNTAESIECHSHSGNGSKNPAPPYS